MDIVSKVIERLKLSKKTASKLRSTANLAGAESEKQIETVLAGIQRGEKNVANAKEALSVTVDYPQRVDECPVCFAHMQPVTLAAHREAFFCPIHNGVMPSIE